LYKHLFNVSIVRIKVARSTIGYSEVFTPYRPSGRHGHRLWRKKSSCGVVKSLFEASTHVIKATSCVERWNATIKAEEHSKLSSYQTLTTDKNR
jgi:hypothetical protein